MSSQKGKPRPSVLFETGKYAAVDLEDSSLTRVFVRYFNHYWDIAEFRNSILESAKLSALFSLQIAKTRHIELEMTGSSTRYTPVGDGKYSISMNYDTKNLLLRINKIAEISGKTVKVREIYKGGASLG